MIILAFYINNHVIKRFPLGKAEKRSHDYPRGVLKCMRMRTLCKIKVFKYLLAVGKKWGK